MPMFEIEQYEIHCQRYRVEADTEAEAIRKLFDGAAQAVDNSLELVEVASDYGLPVDDYQDLAHALRALDVRIGDDVIPSIRDIQQID